MVALNVNVVGEGPGHRLGRLTSHIIESYQHEVVSFVAEEIRLACIHLERSGVPANIEEASTRRLALNAWKRKHSPLSPGDGSGILLFQALGVLSLPKAAPPSMTSLEFATLSLMTASTPGGRRSTEFPPTFSVSSTFGSLLQSLYPLFLSEFNGKADNASNFFVACLEKALKDSAISLVPWAKPRAINARASPGAPTINAWRIINLGAPLGQVVLSPDEIVAHKRAEGLKELDKINTSGPWQIAEMSLNHISFILTRDISPSDVALDPSIRLPFLIAVQEWFAKVIDLRKPFHKLAVVTLFVYSQLLPFCTIQHPNIEFNHIPSSQQLYDTISNAPWINGMLGNMFTRGEPTKHKPGYSNFLTFFSTHLVAIITRFEPQSPLLKATTTQKSAFARLCSVSSFY
jgi:hypothetical protein